MQKKTLLVTLLIVILTGGLAATGLYIGKQLTQPKEEIRQMFLQKPAVPPSSGTKKDSETTPTEPAEIDTADWKIYRNDEYGFEVKYPHDWEIQLPPIHSWSSRDLREAGLVLLLVKRRNSQILKCEEISEPPYRYCQRYIVQVSIEVIPNTYGTLEDYVNSLLNDQGMIGSTLGGDKSIFKDMLVSGIPAKQWRNCIEAQNYIENLVIYKDLLYNIKIPDHCFFIQNLEEIHAQYRSIYEHILATFTFIN